MPLFLANNTKFADSIRAIPFKVVCRAERQFI